MRGFLAVFERELAERRILAVAALGFGLIAVALPLMPGLQVGGLTPLEVRGGVALGFSLLMSLLTAVFLGGSVLASDLLERRMGFYFSRPLSGWALWSGKIAAALVLTFGTGLLVLLPAALAGSSFDAGGIWGMGWDWTVNGSQAFILWILGLLLLLFGTNAFSVMVRSRSPWVALDMAALVLVAILALSARNRLLMVGVGASPWKEWWVDPLNVFAVMGSTLVLVTLAALFLAGAVQVVRGRTDVRRAHSSVSATLWGVLLVLGLAFQVLTFWWVRATPADLMGVTQVVAAPNGSSSWIGFEGPAAHRPGYSPGFLYDVASGRTVSTRMGPLATWWGLPLRVSADGRRAVWLEFQGLPFRSPLNIYRFDLRRPGAAPEPTRIFLSGLPEGLALSPDGRRLAVAARHRLTVEDVDTGRLLASASYDGELWFSRLFFAGPDRVRLYRSPIGDGEPGSLGARSFDILELDSATGKLDKTGSVKTIRGLTDWGLSPGGERMILLNRRQCQLRDARTGELLADFGATEGSSASFLNDGRVAQVSPVGELRILARDGVQELRRFRFQGVQTLIPVDQPAPGSLRVVTSRTGEPGGPWDLRVLDLQTGGVQTRSRLKLAPLNPPSRSGSRLSLEGGQGVIWKEPFSHRWRVILRDSGAV